MGKRSIVFAIALFTFAATFFFQNGSGGDDLDSLHSLTTRAQELLAQPTVVHSGSRAVIGDSLLERPVVFKAIPIAGDTSYMKVWVTAYTSDPAQTDDTPFITASGSMVRDGVAAANFLPIGTQFRIPDMFGDKVFVVEDRMNTRYNNQHIVDIWFEGKEQAIDFGKRVGMIELL